MYITALTLALLALAGGPAGPAQRPSPNAAQLTVAAASDLQAMFPELVSRFERDTGVGVAVAFGASGTFFAQIQNGAPFDLFFSADIDYPRRLGASGYADAGSLFQYATGRLVVWTRQDSGIDLGGGLAALRDPRVRRIAIANPTTAPYGRAAVAALRTAKLYDEVQPKLVMAENVSQAAQLADSGNADAAIIGSSLALGPALRASGTTVAIPASAHPPIEQAAIIVAASRQKDAARRFLDYLVRPEIRELFQRSGFTPPPAP